VISEFGKFVSRLSSTLFQTILLTFQATHFTAVPHAGSLVSCHNFRRFCSGFNKWSRPGILYFQCKIVVFLVNILYAEAKEAANSCAALSASLEEWIWKHEFRGKALKQFPVFQMNLKLPLF
jgi:hypothetical protein